MLTFGRVDTLGAVPKLALGRGLTGRNWPLWCSKLPMVFDHKGFFLRWSPGVFSFASGISA